MEIHGQTEQRSSVGPDTARPDEGSGEGLAFQFMIIYLKHHYREKGDQDLYFTLILESV